MNDSELRKLCQDVLEALPRLKADPSLSATDREFLRWVEVRGAKPEEKAENLRLNKNGDDDGRVR